MRLGRERHSPARRCRAAGVAAGLLAACLLCACFGTPTPLAPGLEGSVGMPHHGVQTGAVELPVKGPGFLRFRRRGSYYWAQPNLVRAIQRAALRVRKEMPGGAPLMVGDLSARHGGKISRHNSHRNGRDVDLLWYVTTPRGTSIRNPSFVQVGADGLAQIPDSSTFVFLDVPRQWLLIRALLQSSDVEVQWMFCSKEVEALVIDYALSRGEDAELIWKAQNVLLEPGDSLPHDDHIHLRVACSPQASIHGCEGGGPYWSWLPPPAELEPLPEASLLTLLTGERAPASTDSQ